MSPPAADADWERGTNAWNIALGVLLAREAGSIASDPDGGTLDLRGQRVCMSNGATHALLIENLKTAVAEVVHRRSLLQASGLASLLALVPRAIARGLVEATGGGVTLGRPVYPFLLSQRITGSTASVAVRRFPKLIAIDFRMLPASSEQMNRRGGVCRAAPLVVLQTIARRAEFDPIPRLRKISPRIDTPTLGALLY